MSIQPLLVAMYICPSDNLARLVEPMVQVNDSPFNRGNALITLTNELTVNAVEYSNHQLLKSILGNIAPFMLRFVKPLQFQNIEYIDVTPAQFHVEMSSDSKWVAL